MSNTNTPNRFISHSGEIEMLGVKQHTEPAVGPFPPDYTKPHVFARDVHSGAGNCVCGMPPFSMIHMDFLTKMATESTPVAAGLVIIAADSGRVLMQQRTNEAVHANGEVNKAPGMWEFPGGCIEDGEKPFVAARREWEEETGLVLPPGKLTGQWTSPDGVYTGFIWQVKNETMIHMNPDQQNRMVPDPDHPDGSYEETVAWWDPTKLARNMVVRAELRNGCDFSVLVPRGDSVRQAYVELLKPLDAVSFAELEILTFAEWEEAKHPRAEDGRFGSGGSESLSVGALVEYKFGKYSGTGTITGTSNDGKRVFLKLANGLAGTFPAKAIVGSTGKDTDNFKQKDDNRRIKSEANEVNQTAQSEGGDATYRRRLTEAQRRGADELWYDGGSNYVQIRDASLALLTGSSVPQEAKEDLWKGAVPNSDPARKNWTGATNVDAAEDYLHDIANGKKYNISRGIATTSASLADLTRVGVEMTLPLASWTTDDRVSTIFSGGYRFNKKQNTERVVFTTSSRGTPIELGKIQSEIVTAGKFKISSVERKTVHDYVFRGNRFGNRKSEANITFIRLEPLDGRLNT